MSKTQLTYSSAVVFCVKKYILHSFSLPLELCVRGANSNKQI